jgi:hypothetical protein
MKQLLAMVMLAVLSTAYAAEEKKVCTDVVGKDGKPVVLKDGTTKQSCKTIKIHKKVEGEAVPDKK